MSDTQTGGRAADNDAHDPGRPKVFTPGTAIGMHLRVERLVRIAGDRVTYLVNNRNPRWHTFKCWYCGNKHSPANAQACTYCSKPLGPQRFLMTARWNPASSMEYQAYAHRRLRFRSLASPLALYRYRDQLLACFPWDHDQPLIGEPAPLPGSTVLSLAFQMADALAALHAHGVLLDRIDAGQVLIHPSGTARLFDLEVARLIDRPLPANDDPTLPPLKDLRDLATLLERWVAPDDVDVLTFLKGVRRGAYRTADSLAAGVSTFAWSRKTPAPEPHCAALSDTGIVRVDNEDFWGWRQLSHEVGPVTVYVVADGMGGHTAGAEASRLAVRTLLRSLQRAIPMDTKAIPAPKALERLLHRCMEEANEAIVTVNEEQSTQMGTTAVALLQTPDTLVLANLGDSRAYLLRGGELRQLTEDHSVVAARIAAGTLTREEARKHPSANVLLHYMGRERDADPDIYQLDPKPGDRILLCSDGLWGEVDDRRLSGLLAEHTDPRRTVRRLVRAANDAGGHDNVTALIIDIPRKP